MLYTIRDDYRSTKSTYPCAVVHYFLLWIFYHILSNIFSHLFFRIHAKIVLSGAKLWVPNLLPPSLLLLNMRKSVQFINWNSEPCDMSSSAGTFLIHHKLLEILSLHPDRAPSGKLFELSPHKLNLPKPNHTQYWCKILLASAILGAMHNRRQQLFN